MLYKLCTSVLYLSLCILVYTVHSLSSTLTVNVKRILVCCVNEPVLPHFGYTFSYCLLYQACFQNSLTLLICIFFFSPYFRSANFDSNIFFHLREKLADMCHIFFHIIATLFNHLLVLLIFSCIFFLCIFLVLPLVL
jgi:hypothetical protein